MQANLHFLFEHLNHYDLNKLTKKLHVISGTPIERLVGKSGLLQGDYLGREYACQHAETERLYQEFQAYTALVRDAQLRITHTNLAFEYRLGVLHQSVVDLIVHGKSRQKGREQLCLILQRKEGLPVVRKLLQRHKDSSLRREMILAIADKLRYTRPHNDYSTRDRGERPRLVDARLSYTAFRKKIATWS